ncbi:MAG: TolC family protein [Candidatus Aminicenantes bacterium]|nr:TolC family protein [Candidatus Aminicenantes bacterium]
MTEFKLYIWISRKFLILVMMLFFLFSALSPLPISAQEPQKKFSLKEAQEYAIQHSYDALRSQLDVEASKKRLRETVADGLPQINSALAYLNNLELQTVLIPNFFEGNFDEKIPVQFGTQHNANFSVTVEQKIFDVSYIVGLNTSKIYQRLSDQSLTRTQLDIKEDVTSTYFLILVSEESKRIIQANIANLEKTFFETQERYREGFVEETDVDMLQISITQLKNSLQNIQKQTEVAYRLLNFQMGLDIGSSVELKESLQGILREFDLSETLKAQFDLSRNIDYQLTDTQEKLAEMALRNEKARYWPSISAFYTYQRSAFRDTFSFFQFDQSWFRSQVFGVNVRIPIFKSGAQKARVQQAAIALEKAKTAKIQASQGMLLEESRAKNDMIAAYENYLNIQENMELSKKVYGVTLIKYNEGIASSMDLSQANDRYLLSQSSYIKAISDLLNAKNKLDRIRNSYE